MISSDKYKLARCKMDSGHTKRNISNLFYEELLVCNNDYLMLLKKVHIIHFHGKNKII